MKKKIILLIALSSSSKKRVLTPLCFYYYYSCPFDAVTIYDGPDNMAEKIGTYCGQMRNLVIFSTQNKLYITFTTLKRTAPAQNRGFFAIYEFSESFVKLGKYRFFFLNSCLWSVPKMFFREINFTEKH